MKRFEVIWYTPHEKLPPEDKIVTATICGKADKLIFDHGLVELGWCKSNGWYSPEYDFEELDVLAWCDFEPYRGEKNGGGRR
ncbi:MAG: hypothetical protein IJ703_01300 [Eubacterium sp.]|nr:hypothetical protein [Eubacterium sp.]